MRYFPTVDLTPQVKLLLARGALRLQPGQWVKSAERGIGRYLRTDPRNGVSYVSWVRPEDDWATQAQRFHRACRKGFVGKYRRLYEVVKDERERERMRRGETATEGAPAARDLDPVDALAAA